jgi:hypothetical protein
VIFPGVRGVRSLISGFWALFFFSLGAVGVRSSILVEQARSFVVSVVGGVVGPFVNRLRPFSCRVFGIDSPSWLGVVLVIWVVMGDLGSVGRR